MVGVSKNLMKGSFVRPGDVVVVVAARADTYTLAYSHVRVKGIKKPKVLGKLFVSGGIVLPSTHRQ